MQNVKCESCLNDVKTRISQLVNVTSVSAILERPGEASLVVYTKYPVSQEQLQVWESK